MKKKKMEFLFFGVGLTSMCLLYKWWNIVLLMAFFGCLTVMFGLNAATQGNLSRCLWVSLQCVGTALNGLVIVANGGMPVPQRWYVPGRWWRPLAECRHFCWLGDHYLTFSIGDILLLSGALLLGVSFVVTQTRDRDSGA